MPFGPGHADVLDVVGEVGAVEAVLAEEDLAGAGDPDPLVVLAAGEIVGILRPAFLEEERRLRVVVVDVLDLLRPAQHHRQQQHRAAGDGDRGRG